MRSSPIGAMDLLQIADVAATTQLVLKGTFDAELTELRTLRDEIKERQGIAETVSGAEKVVADANAQAGEIMSKANDAMTKAQAAADALSASAKKLFDEANAKVAAADEINALNLNIQKTLDGKAKRLSADQSALAESKQAFESDVVVRTADLVAKEEKLARDQAALDKRIADFHGRLDQLKVK
jgi:hypothetical protein